MTLNIHWSDRLEKLAETMFSNAVDKSDPFETECTVVGSPVMAGWLKQYFLYEFPKAQKKQNVLAGWDFQMVHPFVNDWVAKAATGTPVGKRVPAEHPYSLNVLQWRIWDDLCAGDQPLEYEVLRRYYEHGAPGVTDRKRWGLASRLAQLFDDYQNYRVDLLREWGSGKATGLSPESQWQAVMWQRLSSGGGDTYLDQFAGLPETLPDCGITEAYKRVTVFHTPVMPMSYMKFFYELGKVMPVQVLAFNPSRDFWIEDATVKESLKELCKNGEELAWMTPPHPILNGFGRGTQAFLAAVLDVTEGDAQEAGWADDEDSSLLEKTQTDIRTKGVTQIEKAVDDGSIQFHACHGPLREVEVVRDLVLKWFEEHPKSQPRDVQVLVPDIETYAPFIESVFRVDDHNPPIPCSISRRPAVSGGAVGAAFIKLMKLQDSRLTASEVIELLELDPVRERYRLDTEGLAGIRDLVNSAGIRWGRDGDHLEKILGSGTQSMPDTVTWRRGLDRMLTGFALGRCEDGDDVIDAGEQLGTLRVHDGVEGDAANLVGTLGQYFQDLCDTADDAQGEPSRPVSRWAEFYTAMLERFFRGTETSYYELAQIRRGIASVCRSAGPAKDPAVGSHVMAAAIEAELGGMAPAGRSDTNELLFSPMRTMQVTPRKLIIMLGLNEGIFPRTEQRAAFDLLAIRPRYGDRSFRYEDRLAFLEAIMSARERLVVTYTGRNNSNNKEMPPSPAVTEFQQYLNAFSARQDENGKKLPLVETIEHKLHGFNAAYYIEEGKRKENEEKLFSYSESNYGATCALHGIPEEKDKSENAASEKQVGESGVGAADEKALPGSTDTVASTDRLTVTLDALQQFFANPAKVFYTQVLQVWLPDPTRDNVSDSELFDGDTLDEYNINKVLLDDILARSESEDRAGFEPEEDYFKRLQEQALIPLGVLGRGSTRSRLSDLSAFMNETRVMDGQDTLYQALSRRRENTHDPTSVDTPCGTWDVKGSLPLIEEPDGRVCHLMFRYATIKPKDRVRAWVAHVVGHASGKTFYTEIIGKPDKKGAVDSGFIEPLPEKDAEAVLSNLLQLYERGLTEALPFAPATSYAYAEKLQADPDDQGTAFAAAWEAWEGYHSPESNDNYLFEAWGEESPMRNGDDFVTVADTFWSGLLAPPPGEAEDDPTGEEHDHE